jgi:hypothetical protein
MWWFSLLALPLLLFGLFAYNDFLVLPWIIICVVWLRRGRMQRNA